MKLQADIWNWVGFFLAVMVAGVLVMYFYLNGVEKLLGG